MNKVKIVGASALFLLGFWCLGRAVETSLDRNPNRLGQRETITAGILLGVPATGGGGWLLWDSRRQHQLQEEERLKNTFFQLVKAGRGKITPLRFSMEAQIDGSQAKAYLSDRSMEYDATYQVDVEGNITYCFHLGNLNSQLLRPNRQPTLDPIKEKQLRDTFFRLVKAGRGKITPLRFSIEAQIDGDAAKAYLSDRSAEYDATTQVDLDGNMTYCFHLGEVDSQLLRSMKETTFDVILEAVPSVKQREIVKTVRDLTGLDWKEVKALVRNVPQPIQQGASRQTAEEFRAALEHVGAQVALVLNDRT
ncbi:ribosomal protein L7/L12 [Oscillatoria sp. CS-180]|uniref:ribosomal protein L7/L12 n=1 Tax=Oscillatoria sp. CS-180 TaxID=3021720 RepID=UPI002330598D|nr:ribosomal protein L7/L12 [Oscillatoria sp. CS-180]MDB9527607.1 ribosomal protein L7/L12 [Oscillatoria sp. CS-180]